MLVKMFNETGKRSWGAFRGVSIGTVIQFSTADAASGHADAYQRYEFAGGDFIHHDPQSLFFGAVGLSNRFLGASDGAAIGYIVTIAALVVLVLALLAWISRLLFERADNRSDLNFIEAVMRKDVTASQWHGKSHAHGQVTREILRGLFLLILAATLVGIVYHFWVSS